MSKNILFGDEARLKMFAGMEKVAKTVRRYRDILHLAKDS